LKVCIAEKPSVAKEIATILKANSRRDGYFEGNGYFVTWTFGHLCTLKTPDDYKPEWKSWRISSLPMLPDRFGIKVIEDSGIKKQFNTIKSLVQKCDEVINCGDAGQEGEVIQRWVLAKAGCKVPIKRLWISSLTEEAIREGFAKLMDGNDFDSLYKAGNARAVADWILGMNASRLYTLKYANNKGVLSIGRVQTPTLSLIVDRDREIKNFKPEKYWELKTLFKNVLFNYQGKRFNSAEKANEFVESIKNIDFTITDFSKKKGKEAPPKLFDLTSLQVECNKKFGMSAEDTLKTAQRLYEKKALTYPRVDTVFLPDDMYPKVPNILKGLNNYKTFIDPLLKSKIKKSKKVFDNKKVTDHHAIVPTGQNANGLNGTEKDVFDLVARRFIANFYPDCEVSNTTVLGQVDKHKFKATGKEILKDGWRELYPKRGNQNSENADSKSQILPAFEKGDTGPHKPKIEDKETTPPKPYTEATLLRAMETAGKQVEDEELRQLMKENGIGRPSTRANIIETLFRRKYIIKQRKNLLSTITGQQLIANIRNELLKSAELTGIWERKLRQIENDEYDARLFVDEMKKMVSSLITEVVNDHSGPIHIEDDEKKKTAKKNGDTKKSTSKSSSSDEMICPKCQKHKIVKGKSAYGCLGFKEGCKFVIPFEIMGKKLTDKQIQTLIMKGKTAKIKGFVIGGIKQEGKIVLNANKVPEFEQIESDKPTKTKEKKAESLICPVCGKGNILKGKAAYGCSKFREGCSFLVKFDELKKQFNTDILDANLLKKIKQ